MEPVDGKNNLFQTISLLVSNAIVIFLAVREGWLFSDVIWIYSIESFFMLVFLITRIKHQSFTLEEIKEVNHWNEQKFNTYLKSGFYRQNRLNTKKLVFTGFPENPAEFKKIITSQTYSSGGLILLLWIMLIYLSQFNFKMIILPLTIFFLNHLIINVHALIKQKSLLTDKYFLGFNSRILVMLLFSYLLGVIIFFTANQKNLQSFLLPFMIIKSLMDLR